MALNTYKYNCVTSLHFKWLNESGLFYSSWGPHGAACLTRRCDNVMRGWLFNRFLVELSVNGSLGLRIVLSGTSSAVNGIAVDWAAGNIYWTDGLYRWIAVTRAQPRSSAAGHKTIVSMNVEQPYGIAVWPHRGYVCYRPLRSKVTFSKPRKARSRNAVSLIIVNIKSKRTRMPVTLQYANKCNDSRSLT